jgi:hypothetical protein
MSLRVSISAARASACSGLMYSGVPIIWPDSVKTVWVVEAAAVALATPKSITFTLGAWPSTSNARMLPGFRSRWITPFRCACCIASQTRWNSTSRSRRVSRLASQNSVMGCPFTYSITK